MGLPHSGLFSGAQNSRSSLGMGGMGYGNPNIYNLQPRQVGNQQGRMGGNVSSFPEYRAHSTVARPWVGDHDQSLQRAHVLESITAHIVALSWPDNRPQLYLQYMILSILHESP
jgi:hypothetical protein